MVTYDGIQTKIFIDGNLTGTFSEIFSIAANTNNLYIGDNPTLGRPFNGTIDEIRILNISRIM